MSIKRKFADRSDLNVTDHREYTQMLVEMDEFKGYVTLVKFGEVPEPIYVSVNKRKLCILDTGYQWLHHLPLDGFHVVTTIFDARGNLIYWYIDICKEIGYDATQNNVPWFDDLFLDIRVLPSGEFTVLDASELQQALDQKEITKTDYDHAWREANRLMDLLKHGQFATLKMSKKHQKTLLGYSQRRLPSES